MLGPDRFQNERDREGRIIISRHDDDRKSKLLDDIFGYIDAGP